MEHRQQARSVGPRGLRIWWPARRLLVGLVLVAAVLAGTPTAWAQQEDGDAPSEAGGGEVITVMARNLYLGADVAIALDLLPDLPAAAQFMWEQVAATDFDRRVEQLAAEVVREQPAVIGLQEATRWRCRGGDLGRLETVFDFTAGFLAATEAAGAPYVVAAADGRLAWQPGYRIPALPFLSRVEDPTSFQPRFSSDRATCGFDLADALLVRADLAERVVAAGGRAFGDRYSVVPTVLVIDRGYAWADLAFDSGTVRFVTTHLESLWDPDAVPHGALQARQLVADLATTTTPVVVMGDLNADPRDPRPAGAANPAGQPEAGEDCRGQVEDPTIDTALAGCNAYWTLRQGGLDDAGPDPLDGANLTWGSSAELAGPDPGRIDAALAMGNDAGFTDRLDHVLVRGGIEVVDTRVIGNVWPDGADLWACDAPGQQATARAAAQRLVEAGVLAAVPDELGCLPTDHAGIVAELRLPPTGLAAAEPPPTVWRSPIGLWGALGLLLLALLVWRVGRRLRRRRRVAAPGA
ncbi:MAG: endonuclease/exonuclease/phosphatase family protein [Nitriliruptoraceae bacterium]